MAYQCQLDGNWCTTFVGFQLHEETKYPELRIKRLSKYKWCYLEVTSAEMLKQMSSIRILRLQKPPSWFRLQAPFDMCIEFLRKNAALRYSFLFTGWSGVKRHHCLQIMRLNYQMCIMIIWHFPCSQNIEERRSGMDPDSPWAGMIQQMIHLDLSAHLIARPTLFHTAGCGDKTRSAVNVQSSIQLVFYPNAVPYRTRNATQSKWNLCAWMGVFTLHASNIKGFAFEFARARPVWIGPKTKCTDTRSSEQWGRILRHVWAHR